MHTYTIRWWFFNCARPRWCHRLGACSRVGNVFVLSEEEDGLNQEGHTIAPDIYPRTLKGPLPLTYRRIWAYDGPMSHISHRVHIALDVTPLLPKNYKGKLQDLKQECSQNPFEYAKDHALEKLFWCQFYFDFYLQIVFNPKSKGVPLILPVQYIDIWHLRKDDNLII